MLRRAMVIGVLAGMVVGGCGDDDGAGGGPTTAAPASLAGTSWALTEGVTAPDDAAFTLRFEDGTAGGTSGCNGYGGEYQQDGSSLTFGELQGTLMACEEDLMTAERAYLDALGATQSFSLDGQTLTLRNADGDDLLTFAAPDPDAIVGDWEAIGVLDREGEAFRSVALETTITASFADDGQLTGNGGCNEYSTTYTVDGESIGIAPPAGTLKLCNAPEGVDQQEALYFQALGEASTFVIEGDVLTLLDGEGIRLVDYQRAS